MSNGVAGSEAGAEARRLVRGFKRAELHQARAKVETSRFENAHGLVLGLDESGLRRVQLLE